MYTEHVCAAVRSLPALQSLMTLESAQSVPVPYWNGSQMYLRFLFHYYRGRPDEIGTVHVRRPHARITVDLDGHLVEYMDLGFETGRPLSRVCQQDIIGEHLSSWNYPTAKRKRSEYHSVVDQVIAIYGQPELGAAGIATLRRFLELFGELVEPPLAPFLRQCSPLLFDWAAAWLEDGGRGA